MGHLRLPWATEEVGGTRAPPTISTDKLIAIAGFVDTDGQIQGYLPVGGSINALPAEDSFTQVFSGTVGAGATLRTSTTIDCNKWDGIVLEIDVDANVGAGELILELRPVLTQFSNQDGVETATMLTETGGVFSITNAGALTNTDGMAALFTKTAGLTYEVTITNGGAAAREFVVYAKRVRRIHV